RAKQPGVLHAGEHGVGIGERGLEMPDAFEFPWVRRPVVPLVRAGHTVIDELVANRRPCLAAVVRTLRDLAEPTGRLGGVEPIRVGGRSLEVKDLPATKMWPGDVPAVPF